MASIRFYHFTRTENGFSCKVKSDKRKKRDVLEFCLSPNSSNMVDNDSIACALSTLCGTAYDSVKMELSVSDECRDDLRAFTQAEWTCEKSLFEKIRGHYKWKDAVYQTNGETEKTRILLNFSGGFDSLAALSLLPKDRTDLVSVDFGGWFQREKAYFQMFHPYTLSTNFRQLKYDKESWKFMGTGAILFSRLLSGNGAYMVFGTILEASPWTFTKAGDYDVTKDRSEKDVPFSTVGLDSIPVMNGLTEVGTAILVSKYYPDQVPDSLKSLAADPSEKRFRKQTLMEIVNERFQRGLELPPCQIPAEKNRSVYGTNLALDFLAIYEMKYRGEEVVSKTVSDIPKEVKELAERLNLTFYERYSEQFLPAVPEDIRAFMKERLDEAGVRPWDEKDKAEYFEVRRFLAKYHPELSR